MESVPPTPDLPPETVRSFFFPRQLGRLAWLCRCAVSFLAMVGMGELVGLISDPNLDWLRAGLSLVVMLSFLVYMVGWIHLPRARDLGMPGYFLLGMFVPLVNTVLGFFLLLAKAGAWTKIEQRNQPRWNAAPQPMQGSPTPQPSVNDRGEFVDPY